VGRSDIGGAYILPLRIVPERGKAPEYGIESPKSESADVFHDRVAGSKLANKAGVLEPESASLTLQPSAFTSDGNILARKSSRQNPIPDWKRSTGDGPDVSERYGVGESQAIDLISIGVNLRIEVSVEMLPGPFGPEGEAAYSREQVEEVGVALHLAVHNINSSSVS
jgi:hypothetical protein